MTSINIIDIEASGLHFDSYPIEVALLVNGQTFSWLIKPETAWHYWCETAEAMHGISRVMLQEKGKRVNVVATEILDVLKNTNGLLYSDAADWDLDWMRTLFHAAKEPMPFHILSIYDLLQKDQADSFKYTKSKLVESGRYRQHRAGEDVRLIFEAYITASQ